MTTFILFQDRGEITDRSETPDGFVRVRARFARSGIQDYLAGEIGLTDRKATDAVKVYRPPEEVFSPDSMQTFSGVPVTNNHPSVMLDTKNAKQYMVGFSGEIVERQDNFMTGTITLTDDKVIELFREGKKELSNGYRADLDLTPGVTPDGIAYDAVQRNIRGNHIALVDMGRCGPACRIMDGSEMTDCGCKGNKVMAGENSTTAVVDGISYQMSDQVAGVVAKLIKDRDETGAALKTAQTDIATRDAKIAGLEKSVEDAKKAIPEGAALDALIVERGNVLDKAKLILGSDTGLSGLPTGDVKRKAVDKVLGDTAKAYTPEQVSAAFDAIAVATKDSVRQGIAAGTGVKPKVETNDAETARLALYTSNMDRWQGNQGKGN